MSDLMSVVEKRRIYHEFSKQNYLYLKTTSINLTIKKLSEREISNVIYTDTNFTP